MHSDWIAYFAGMGVVLLILAIVALRWAYRLLNGDQNPFRRRPESPTPPREPDQ